MMVDAGVPEVLIRQVAEPVDGAVEVEPTVADLGKQAAQALFVDGSTSRRPLIASEGPLVVSVSKDEPKRSGSRGSPGSPRATTDPRARRASAGLIDTSHVQSKHSRCYSESRLAVRSEGD
jgi:hypothetical protein